MNIPWRSRFHSIEASFGMILLTALALALPPAAFARQSRQAEIRIQVLDSQTHRPLRHRSVQVTLSGMDGQFYEHAPETTGRTGRDGIAIFKVNQPAPPIIGVFVRWAYPCSNTQAYSTSAVFKNGVVVHWPGLARRSRTNGAQPIFGHLNSNHNPER